MRDLCRTQFAERNYHRGDEIPYVTAVVTETYDESDAAVTRIQCAIYVERSSQKGIIIGAMKFLMSPPS